MHELYNIYLKYETKNDLTKEECKYLTKSIQHLSSDDREVLFMLIFYYIMNDGKIILDTNNIVDMYQSNKAKFKNVYSKNSNIKGINIKMSKLDTHLKYMLYKFCKTILNDDKTMILELNTLK